MPGALQIGDVVGSVAELWRYPVKGMRGERLPAVELDAHGVAGDRRFAIESSGAPAGKPLLSGAERAAMLLFHARTDAGQTSVTVPDGRAFAVDDAVLLQAMASTLPGGHALHMVRSAVPLTDVRPVALLGVQTVAALAEGMAREVDPRRFRANVLLDTSGAFSEEALVGRTVRIGEQALLRVTERDPRCRIVTLDPETAAADPYLMRYLDRHRDGCVGVYARVLKPGMLRTGDALTIV